jgi:hypothetical protein
MLKTLKWQISLQGASSSAGNLVKVGSVDVEHGAQNLMSEELQDDGKGDC